MNKVTFFPLMGLFLLSGCGQSTKPDFCKDFKNQYQDHAKDITKVRGDLSDDASLNLTISFSKTAASEIGDLSNFSPASFAGRTDCELTHLQQRDMDVNMTYQCDTDNGRIKNVNLNLLENYSALDAMEVEFITPAVKKRYIIHRNCSKPIFL